MPTCPVKRAKSDRCPDNSCAGFHIDDYGVLPGTAKLTSLPESDVGDGVLSRKARSPGTARGGRVYSRASFAESLFEIQGDEMRGGSAARRRHDSGDARGVANADLEPHYEIFPTYR